MIHRSKIDMWLIVVLLAGFSIGAFGAVAAVLEGKAPLIVPLIALPVMAALFLWLPFTIRYEIEAAELCIRFGPFRWRIEVRAIREIRPSRNPLSAPAASLDRLRIEYEVRGGHRFALVSPSDKAAFLRDLASIDPGLRVEKDRLTRGG